MCSFVLCQIGFFRKNLSTGITIECPCCFFSDSHNICPRSVHVLFQVVFPCVNIITHFTFEWILLVRLFVTIECTFQQILITNVTAHICMTFSNVVLQQELCIEFPLTYVAIRLVFLVVLSEVFLETTFITEKFATILAGSFLSNVHGPQVCESVMY